MADHAPPPHRAKVRPHHHGSGGPSFFKILALLAILPIGGLLAFSAGLAFSAAMTCALVATPLFLIFSPVLAPAIVVICLAVAGILAPQALKAKGSSAFSWALDHLRRVMRSSPVRAAVDQIHEMAKHLANSAQGSNG